MKIFANLQPHNQYLVIFTGFLLIGLLGFFDYFTGYELSFSVFYVIPIFLITWVSNSLAGYIASIVSAIVWFLADKGSGHTYSYPHILYWNSIIRLAFFSIITFLLAELKSSLLTERELSHTDYLTNAANSRYFYELVQIEINRFERNPHPFTIAYIDVDDFKMINDRLGHSEGDLVLKKIVETIERNIRKSDFIARLGGDEFALLLPFTDEEVAKKMLPRIHQLLLEEMSRQNRQVTFSIGVVTYLISPQTVNEAIRTADELMYAVKQTSKNMVRYSVYGQEEGTTQPMS